MAFIFDTPLSETSLLNSYNNNIIEFHSDNVLDATKCNINIGGSNYEITPNTNNVFRYDFKEVSSILINSNNFKDDILPSLTLATESSHVYDDTSGAYLSELVTFTITFSDDSTEQTTKTFQFFKSVEQLEQNKKGVITTGGNIYILSPFNKATANTYSSVYFEGYPFDVSIYLASAGTTNILNQTNGLDHNFPLNYTVNRLFFSDGRTTITLNDFIPLVEGLNELKITRGADIIYLNLYKVSSREGQFVKWINNYGGFNYWLFNCRYKRERTAKNIDDINNDFNNVSQTVTPFYNIGVNSEDKLTLIADSLKDYESEILDGIFESPRVYYFTGIRLAQVTDVSWLSVKVNSRKTLIRDYRREIKNYKVEIELPKRYTMTL